MYSFQKENILIFHPLLGIPASEDAVEVCVRSCEHPIIGLNLSNPRHWQAKYNIL